MARPTRPPDLLVEFSLTAPRSDGTPRRVTSGYRAIYQVRSDYWSSAHHEFIDAVSVRTGEQGRAEVWLLAPEDYPHTFWIGRRVEVAEGAHVVGSVVVLEIRNVTLESGGADEV